MTGSLSLANNDFLFVLEFLMFFVLSQMFKHVYLINENELLHFSALTSYHLYSTEVTLFIWERVGGEVGCKLTDNDYLDWTIEDGSNKKGID